MDLTEIRFTITECKDYNNATEIQNVHFELDKLNTEIKKLEKFKDDHLDLWVSDKPIIDLLHLFFNRQSDASKLEATEQEDMEREFAEFVEGESWQIET